MSFDKIQISLKSHNGDGTLDEELRTCILVSRLIFLKMQNVSKMYKKLKRKYYVPKNVSFMRQCVKIWYSQTCTKN
jgi:hypothetical protein